MEKASSGFNSSVKSEHQGVGCLLILWSSPHCCKSPNIMTLSPRGRQRGVKKAFFKKIIYLIFFYYYGEKSCPDALSTVWVMSYWLKWVTDNGEESGYDSTVNRTVAFICWDWKAKIGILFSKRDEGKAIGWPIIPLCNASLMTPSYSLFPFHGPTCHCFPVGLLITWPISHTQALVCLLLLFSLFISYILPTAILFHNKGQYHNSFASLITSVCTNIAFLYIQKH